MKTISIKVEDEIYELFKYYCRENGTTMQNNLSEHIKSKAWNYILSFPSELYFDGNVYFEYSATNDTTFYVRDKGDLPYKYIFMNKDRTIRYFDKIENKEYIIADYIGVEVIMRNEIEEG